MRYKHENDREWVEEFESHPPRLAPKLEWDERDHELAALAREKIDSLMQFDLECSGEAIYIGIWESANNGLGFHWAGAYHPTGGPYGIRIFRSVVDIVGWENYSHEITHELAHVEQAVRMGFSAEDRSHRKLCEMMGVPQNTFADMVVPKLGYNNVQEFINDHRQRL